MKQKLKNIAFAPVLLTLILLMSCDRVGTNESVEFWKTEVGWKYYWGTHHIGEECNEPLGKYLESRFNSMVSKPNEYQLAYLTLAKHFSYLIDMKQTDSDMKNEISEEVKKTIRLATVKYCPDCGEPLELKGDLLECSVGYYCGGYTTIKPWAYGRFSDDVLANMQAHTDLYIDNVCKIIGPLDDLREAVKKSVEVKELRTKTVGGFKRFNVLYEVNHERYVICTITEKGEGKSQISFDFSDNDIDKVLDMWELNNYFNNLAE